MNPSLVSDVLASGLVQAHALSKLGVGELLCLGRVSQGFRAILLTAPDDVWRSALKRTLPLDHPLLQRSDHRQAASQYAATQQAISSGAGSPVYAVDCLLTRAYGLAILCWPEAAVCRSLRLDLTRPWDMVVASASSKGDCLLVLHVCYQYSLMYATSVSLFQGLAAPVQQQQLRMRGYVNSLQIAWSSDGTQAAFAWWTDIRHTS